MFPPYQFTDLNPSLPLSDIMPLSRRAWAALARYQNARAAMAGQMKIIGAIDMLDGLEYHHAAFMRIIEQLASASPLSEQWALHRRELVHEAVAYLNRMGQFYYFADSSLVRQFIPDPDSIIPTIVLYKPFRDKHAAHRAIDHPRKDDTPQAQANYAWALSSVGAMGFAPKVGMRPTDGSRPFSLGALWSDYYFYLQMHDGQPGAALDFSLEREHPIISAEAYALLERLLMAP
jgi:hypothetical protein